MLDLSLTVLYRLSFDCSCLCSNYISKTVVINNWEGGYKTGGGGVKFYPYKKKGGGGGGFSQPEGGTSRFWVVPTQVLEVLLGGAQKASTNYKGGRA